MTLPDTNNLPLPFFMANAEGVITYVNAAWRKVFSRGVGDHWLSLFPEVAPADFEAQWRRIRQPDEAPLRLRSSSVSVAGQTRVFDIHCQSGLETENDPTRLMATLVDVTDQVRGEAEILAILDTAVDAVIIMDEDGYMERLNAAAVRLFGYTASEMQGQPVTLLMPEPHRSRHEAYVQHYLTSGEKKIIGKGRELQAVTKSGRQIPIYLAVSEINQQGRRRFTGIIHDLSEQQAAREALAEQRERLAHVGRLSTMGEMTASIAHEINQPLTAIAMYAQSSIKLIDRGNANPDKLRAALEKLNTQSLRAGAIIERIQRFARPQQSQREMTRLSVLLTDLLKLAESDARLHEVELKFELAQDLPIVLCDPIQIQQVALNLIRNAIDAMSEIHRANGRTIVIQTRAVGSNMVEVSVADQGPGVAEDVEDLLFTPFHTTKKDGMGMGLSICRTIIAQHGGVLSFRNNEDCGATFYFTLPIETAKDE